jgi:elongation factor P--beta-lysine ligase
MFPTIRMPKQLSRLAMSKILRNYFITHLVIELETKLIIKIIET